MKGILHKNYLLIAWLLTVSLFGYCQFPSTDSYVLCNEIPKAQNIGDTVYSHTCNLAGSGYILIQMDSKGRYTYIGLNDYKSKVIVWYDENNRVQRYKYKFNSGLWGGSGKGFFIIHYYDNGNIKDYVHYNTTMGKLCIYSPPLEHIEKDLSKTPGQCFNIHKKGKSMFLTKKYLINKREFRKERKKSNVEPFARSIDGLSYQLYIMEPIPSDN